MSIETTDTIAGLVTTNPEMIDPVYGGPRHFWLIKSVLKKVFPGKDGHGFAKPITATEDEINYLSGLTGPVNKRALRVTTRDAQIVFVDLSDTP